MGRALADDRKITNEQKQIMRRGVEAGKKFTELLEKGSFTDAMANADTYVFPWMAAIELVFDFVGSFFPDTEELILEEIIRGFKQVNARLDIIINELGEIKKLIKWKDMEVRFGDIEARIRLLDSTLKDTLRSPNRKDGVNQFISIFNSQYQSAGFFLYDSVAKNDQVFSKNLLSAAMKFSDNTRKQTQKFSKGLLGLLLKAVNVEIGAEKFKRLNTGRKVIWQDRMKECRRAMQAADKALETEGWKNQMKVDSDRTGYSLREEKNHWTFCWKLYDFLAEKYYWRKWMVLAYNEVKGYSKHAVDLPKHAHKSFRKYGRNYIVVSTDPKSPWDIQRAKNNIRDVTCRALPHRCHRNTATWMIKLLPKYKSRILVQARTRLYYKGDKSRYAAGFSKLRRPTPGWYDRYNVVYFG